MEFEQDFFITFKNNLVHKLHLGRLALKTGAIAGIFKAKLKQLSF